MAYNVVIKSTKLYTMIEYKEVKRYGFDFYGVVYVWRKKELFRLPYSKNNRYYSERKIKLRKSGNSFGYTIDGKFRALSSLKDISKEKIKVVERFDDGVPF